MRKSITLPHWLFRWLKPSIEFCDRKSTYEAKGLCMLLIIFHHIYVKLAFDMGLSIPYAGLVLGPGGYLGTGLFFFLSGYGLYHSLSRQKHLNFSYLYTRIIKMLCVYVVAFGICVSLKWGILEKSSLIDFLTLTIPGTTTWFFKVILALYIITFYMFKINISKELKVIMISIISLLYYSIALKYLPDFWYTSILCFPAGMFVALKKKWFSTYIQILICFIFVVFFRYVQSMEMRFVTAITFCFAVLFVMRYVTSNSKILNYIGTNSLCFYLFQLVLLRPLMVFQSHPLLYVGMVIFMVSLLSFIYVRWIEPRFNTYLK